MILQLKSIAKVEAEKLAKSVNGFLVQRQKDWLIVIGSGIKSIPDSVIGLVEKHWVMDTDIQLASTQFQSTNTQIDIAGKIIGKPDQMTLIAGPCSVESREQIFEVAEFLSAQGASYIRAGCYKPRTSPYSFQGLELEGLKLLREAADTHNLRVVSEAKDYSHVHHVIEYADIIQIGTKAMYDQSLLRACGASGKPILLKRGFGSTLQEFVQAAEFVLSANNPNVILCERGIRTFENKTRFTLDLTGVAYLKAQVNLPIVVDPSHAMGYAYGVPDLARAATAMGIDGLLIEVHPTPKHALSDAAQQLDFDAYEKLTRSLQRVADSVDKHLV